MASPKVRTALRSGDIAAWDFDRLCAVSASLDQCIEATLVPAGMKAVVSFEPA